MEWDNYYIWIPFSMILGLFSLLNIVLGSIKLYGFVKVYGVKLDLAQSSLTLILLGNIGNVLRFNVGLTN